MARQGIKDKLDPGGQRACERVSGRRAVRDWRDDRLVCRERLHQDDGNGARRAGTTILLLFIYLELGTIVGIYFRTDRLPVLFPALRAITALTAAVLAVDVKGPIPDVRAFFVVTGLDLRADDGGFMVQLAASKFPMSG
jgi:hypothetical protein